MPCRRFLVSGRVQGVFFRASTREMAMVEQLSGWARNLEDGRVEVVAQGEQGQLDRLQQWLKQGPPMAQVTGLQVEELDPTPVEADAGFKIR